MSRRLFNNNYNNNYNFNYNFKKNEIKTKETTTQTLIRNRGGQIIGNEGGNNHFELVPNRSRNGGNGIVNNNWQDASAIWHTGFDADFSNNFSLIDLSVSGFSTSDISAIFFPYFASLLLERPISFTYDNSNGIVYAGGFYSSKANNGNGVPFVCSTTDGKSWQDGSAIWHDSNNAFDGDISLNAALVTSLTYDNSNSIVYAGGAYSSIDNSDNTAPFVCSSTDNGITWQDGSAIWHTGFDQDISFNDLNIVIALTYDNSNSIVYAGGAYSSIDNSDNTAPFVCSSTDNGKSWQDGSAIWHTGFDGDISFNNINDFENFNSVTSLTYDNSNSIVYAGGVYSSIDNSGIISPFVCSSTDNGKSWQDGSAIWHTGFDGDNAGGFVTALTYDPNHSIVYAGGFYVSLDISGIVPFVCSSTDNGKTWQDGSAIWHTGFDGDISFNDFDNNDIFIFNLNNVNSLTYDPNHNVVYAGGSYLSIDTQLIEPFVCSSSDGGKNWQDASAIWHSNAFDGDVSLNLPYGVTALTYDTINDKIYAGGTYCSNANQGNIYAFVANKSGIIPPIPPPIPPIPTPKSIPHCCPPRILPKLSAILGGSGSGIQGNHQTEAFYVASRVQIAFASKNTRTTFVNNNLNVYGAYGGAIGGSRGPPRNSF